MMTRRSSSLVARLRGATWVRAATPWAWLARDVIRLRRLARRAKARPDAFDVAYGVRTRIVPPLAQLCRTTRRGGFEHEPSAPESFRRVLESLAVDFGATVFVDYGSGAGRAVLLALEYPFKAVVGIEISPWLHARAQANLRAFPAASVRAGAVRLVCGDAGGYEPPPDPAVLYFYNPFGAGVMRRALANIEASLARHPRPITTVLACCYKEPRAVMAESASFQIVRVDGAITILRSVSPAEVVTPAPLRSTA